MAMIDYAFLADFAKVEPNGTLTAVGASFTFIEVGGLPAGHLLAVAGRVRGVIDETVDLTLEIKGPDDAFRIGANLQLEPGPGSRPYGDGKIGHLFAINVQIPLPTAGLYTVELSTGKSSRRLAFEVTVPSEG
jgi:hypothetical protein